MQIIKISGHELDDDAYLERLAGAVAALEPPLVIVHGGGKTISELQTQLGIMPRRVNGVRITDAESLAIVEMVLCGLVNKRLVRVLVNAGINAIGLSGVDGGLIAAAPMPPINTEDGLIDMGFTGMITGVRANLIHALIAHGALPVIAPVCLGETSNLNVNADHVAGALATALEVDQLIFLSNVPGVLHHDHVIPYLTPITAHELIAQGVVQGGMIPKIETALFMLDAGIRAVRITDLDGLRSGSGTTFALTH